MGVKANLVSVPPGRGGSPPRGPLAPATRAVLHWVVLAGVVGLAAGAGAGFTRASEDDWAALTCGVLALWVAWLYWRTAEADSHVPVHLLYPHLAVPILILLGHLLREARVNSANGAVELIVAGETGVLMRLMTLGLLVLVAQDVLSRVRHLRWLLTGLGLTMAMGAALRLGTSPEAPGALAAALIGFAGVGILLTPCLVPTFRSNPYRLARDLRLGQAAVTARIAVAAVLAVWLSVLEPLAAAVTATAAAAAAMLSGAFLKHHRVRLLAGGAILAVGGAVAICRLGVSPPRWLGSMSLLGAGDPPDLANAPTESGLRVLGRSSGWLGMAAVGLGLLAALCRSLYACRGVAPGDQARAAWWAGVAVVSAVALLGEGGMAIPGVAVAAAVAFALMPHLMAHRVARFRGWSVAAVFAALLVVLGMAQPLGGQRWAELARRHGDATMHFFAAMVLTVVLFWQARPRRWWQGLLCAAGGAGLTALGELAQEHLAPGRSLEFSDIAADVLGALAALSIFLLIRAAGWIEQLWRYRPTRVSFEKYQLWRAP